MSGNNPLPETFVKDLGSDLAARIGPRPLPVHTGAAMSGALAALAALPLVHAGGFAWSDDVAVAAADLGPELRACDLAALSAAVAEETVAQLGIMLRGIDAYHRHPFNRDLPVPPVCFTKENMRLYDYGAEVELSPGQHPTVLMVPSLVNGSQILDLTERRSLLRWLATQGIRPYLVDWGCPGEMEKSFMIGDYVEDLLLPALDHVIAAGDGKPVLAGYCMGGNLTLVAALARQRQLAGAAFLATPRDFHTDTRVAVEILPMITAGLEPILAAFGELPVDILQTFFAVLDPTLAQRKFRQFAEMEAASGAADLFVALEDWLNQGVPLVAGVARECFTDWYRDNAPARGEWQVAGRPINPAELKLPALVAAPEGDRIVPPKSAQSLFQALPEAVLLSPAAGHIGMVAGGKAMDALWRPLADWIFQVTKVKK